MKTIRIKFFIKMFFAFYPPNLWGADDVHRISITGARFILDYSNPGLGEAFKDPSGIIWGDIAIIGGSPYPVNKMEAEAYCARRGARLPSQQDIILLNYYLGGFTQKFSPYVKDRKDLTVLPHLDLEEVVIWTSSKPKWPGWSDFSFVAAPGLIEGTFPYLDSHVARATVRCVAGHRRTLE